MATGREQVFKCSKCSFTSLVYMNVMKHTSESKKCKEDMAGVISVDGGFMEQSMKEFLNETNPPPVKKPRGKAASTAGLKEEYFLRTVQSMESMTRVMAEQTSNMAGILNILQSQSKNSRKRSRSPSPYQGVRRGGASASQTNNPDSSDDSDDDMDQRVQRLPGAVKPDVGVVRITRRQSYITRTLAACILIIVCGRSVVRKGLSQKINSLLRVAGIDPCTDVSPRNKELLSQIESSLKVNLVVHNWKRRIIYNGGFDHTTVPLVWCRRAWYFIDKIDSFFSIYECPACPMVSNDAANLNRHFTRCSFYKHYIKTGEMSNDVEPREERVVTGIWHGMKQNKLIDDLNAVTNLNICMKDIFKPYISVIDCESALLRNSDIVGGLLAETRSTLYVSSHKMYSFGITSNIPGYDTVKIFMRSTEYDKSFLREFVVYLLEAADVSHKLMTDKLGYIFRCFKRLIDWYTALEYEMWVLKLKKAERQLDTYIRRLLVCGYNIFRYDMTLARREGILDILNELDGPVNVMKRTKGSYLTISSERLRFSDQINYTGKISLRELLKQHGTEEKSYFPYGKVRTVADLKQGLPTYDDFHDRLYGCNALDADYLRYKNKLQEGLTKAQALKALNITQRPKKGRELYSEIHSGWVRDGHKTTEDIMKAYLKDDLDPLKNLIIDHRMLYLMETNVDLYSQYLSMSQFSFNYAHSFVDESKYFFVHLPLNLRKKLQESLTGGLSIVFHRLAERGMAIRPTERDDGEAVTKILGVDATNLYGYSMAQDQCFGFLVFREASTDFKPQYMGERFSESIQWLSYCSQVLYKTKIRTQWSQEGEQCVHVPLDTAKSDSDPNHKKQFKSFRVDGYFVDKHGIKWVLEFLGERWHGYCMNCRTPENDNEKLAGDKTSAQLRKLTYDRLQMIRSVCDNIVVIYDCQWKFQKRNDPQVRAFMSTFSFGPLITKKKLTQDEALDKILDREIRGFVQVDATVPLELRNPAGLADFAPIIKNAMLSRQNITGYGREYAVKNGLLEKPIRSLIPSYFCEQTYLSTEYVIMLDSLGVKITFIHEIMQFRMANMFLPFIMDKSSKRVQADISGQKHLAKLQKDTVNQSYGSSLLNASGLISTKLVDESKVLRMVGNHLFIDAEPCGFEDRSSLWELITRKSVINHRNLITLGYNILQGSKVHILKYYYNHLKKYIPDRCFQLINGDTDSFYLAHSRATLRDCVPKRLLPKYDRSYSEWHVDEADPWSKRTPGKFHTEFSGTHICAPAVKLYAALNEDTGEEKKAHRGIQARHSDNLALLNYQSFKDVLLERNDTNPKVKMTGFVDKYGQIITYESRRKSLTAALFKTHIKQDLISTKPFDNI